jgi:hypothetical protein
MFRKTYDLLKLRLLQNTTRHQTQRTRNKSWVIKEQEKADDFFTKRKKEILNGN